MGRTQTRTCHMPCQHIQGTCMTPIESIVTLVHLSTEHSSTLAWGLSKDQTIWQSGLSTINTGNKLCRTGSSALKCRTNAEYQRIRQAANCASVIMATGNESEFQHQGIKGTSLSQNGFGTNPSHGTMEPEESHRHHQGAEALGDDFIDLRIGS